MQKYNEDKTISANSNGIIISYQDANKHQYVNYDHIRKIQLEGTTRYQTIEEPIFSTKQKELFNRVMYGFKIYTREETSVMPVRMKTNITIAYTKAQRILRRWKQDIIFDKVDDLLTSIFPHSKMLKQFVKVKGIDEDGTCNYPSENPNEEITFNDLGIGQKAIADKLIEHNLLPKNFYQLI